MPPPSSVPDPYRALGLPHGATPEQVKRSYRELARRHHPDRLLARRRRGGDESRRESGGGNNSGGDEKEEKEGEEDEGEEERHRREHGLATARFAEISAAYSLLSDPRRKAEYDHVYRYGGYDDINDDDHEEEEAKDGGCSARRREAASAPASASAPPHSSCHPTSRKRKSSTGVGYAYADPLAFLWTGGRVHARAAAAGVELPPSRHSGGGARDLPFGGGGGGGIRFAFSTAHLAPASPAAGAPPGTRVWRSETTTYSLFGRGGAGGAGGGGRPAVDRRVETTTIRPDGTTETTVRLNPPAASPPAPSPASPPAPPARFPLPAFSLFPGGAGSRPRGAEKGTTTTAAATTAAAASASSSPWYAHAWSGIRDRVLMCYGAPCGPPAAPAAAR